MGRTKFSTLRDDVTAKDGASALIAAMRVDALEEIRLFELRHGEAVGQASLGARRERAGHPVSPT